MAGALEGVRVLDLSRLLPGPFASQLLADYGAEVIKVEEPGRGDYMREFGPFVDGESAFFLNLNRNKKSICLDLKQPEGRAVFLDLARRADVILESFRPGVMDRLGIGYDALGAWNPTVVYCALTGYGQDGPHAGEAGHDVNYLGRSGILSLLKDPGGRPIIPGFQIADVGGGALNAVIGILIALYARARTGRGQMVDAAMVDGLAPWLVHRWACRLADEPGTGEHLSGEYPCYALYETSDHKYLAVGALEPKFWERLCWRMGRAEWVPLQFAVGAERDRVFEGLAGIFRSRTRDHWCRELADVDCCVTPVLELHELPQSPHWQARGLAVRREAAGRGPVDLLGFPVKLSETPPSVRLPPPRLGEHTDEILAWLGYDAAKVQSLRGAGAAA